MKGKILLGTFILSSLAFANGMENAASSAAISSNQARTDKGIFYIAKDFTEMAALPGFTLSAPAGLVPGAGVVFGGVSGTYNSVEHTDGAMGFGIGYGNPYETLGGAISLSLGSINPDDGGAFNRGNLNVSVGHTFKEYGFGVAVGMSENSSSAITNTANGSTATNAGVVNSNNSVTIITPYGKY